MNIDITRQVIDKLSVNPLFKLFFNYHFEIVEIKSMIPKHRRDGSIYFPVKTIIKPKKITREESFKFFEEYWDMLLEKEGVKSEEEVFSRI